MSLIPAWPSSRELTGSTWRWSYSTASTIREAASPTA
jgi:hypothetical protein